MSVRLRCLLAFVSLCITGCAGHLPLCPAAGGPAWRELQSAHFRLRTDESGGDARAALSALEQFQAALLTVFRAPPDLPTGALPVIVVRNGWTDFADRQLGGWFTTALFQRLVIMQAEEDLGGQETIKHELVHYLTAKVIPVQPPWLAEGLATYFQTLEIDTDKNQVTVGRPPADLLRVVQTTSLMNVPEMMAAKQVPTERSLFYASAWATVHFLMNHHLDEFRVYESALRDKVAPAEAWTRAFGALTPAALEAEIRAYLDGGQYALLIFPFVPAPGNAVPERMLSDAEVHATRALLLLSGGQNPAARQEFTESNGDYKGRARREIDEALRQDPDLVVARAIGHFDFGMPVELSMAKTATEKNDADWMAWLLLAEALREKGMPGQGDALVQAEAIARQDRSVTLTLRPAAPGAAPTGP